MAYPASVYAQKDGGRPTYLDCLAIELEELASSGQEGFRAQPGAAE